MSLVLGPPQQAVIDLQRLSITGQRIAHISWMMTADLH